MKREQGFSNPLYLVEYTSMSSAERQSTRSPTITSRSDSYRDGPTSRAAGRPYQQRSSITEENEREDNEYEEALDDVDEQSKPERPPQRSEDQYISALRYRFPNRAVTDYVYSKPVGPASMFNLNFFRINEKYFL